MVKIPSFVHNLLKDLKSTSCTFASPESLWFPLFSPLLGRLDFSLQVLQYLTVTSFWPGSFLHLPSSVPTHCPHLHSLCWGVSTQLHKVQVALYEYLIERAPRSTRSHLENSRFQFFIISLMNCFKNEGACPVILRSTGLSQSMTVHSCNLSLWQ